MLFSHLCSLTTLAIPDPLARRETVAFFRAEFDRNRLLLDLVRLWPLLSDNWLISIQDAIENKIKAARREVKLILPLH